MATQAYFMKQETLTNLHLKELETEPKTTTAKKKKKAQSQKEITKIRAEINEIKTKITIEKINET